MFIVGMNNIFHAVVWVCRSCKVCWRRIAFVGCNEHSVTNLLCHSFEYGLLRFLPITNLVAVPCSWGSRGGVRLGKKVEQMVYFLNTCENGFANEYSLQPTNTILSLTNYPSGFNRKTHSSNRIRVYSYFYDF
jgi:hypothetical protein